MFFIFVWWQGDMDLCIIHSFNLKKVRISFICLSVLTKPIFPSSAWSKEAKTKLKLKLFFSFTYFLISFPHLTSFAAHEQHIQGAANTGITIWMSRAAGHCRATQRAVVLVSAGRSQKSDAENVEHDGGESFQNISGCICQSVTHDNMCRMLGNNDAIR